MMFTLRPLPSAAGFLNPPEALSWGTGGRHFSATHRGHFYLGGGSNLTLQEVAFVILEKCETRYRT